ncbi:hypothetical protein [Rhodococcus tukisamuensis]|uniref:Uncharacterized protein n=1 Tax=Rhodococcus tukisamuensis TaxID=168276 RepID=A0A1G6MAJ1_9NOCA|nr:hypothetical protein [Rhodococcus tukisamuensis]SDC52608.1 hypothetical protein SAMN05444580_101113 [Rhodococcus tukisamuensis]
MKRPRHASVPTLLENIAVLGAGCGEYVREGFGHPARPWAERANAALCGLEPRSATGKVALTFRS